MSKYSKWRIDQKSKVAQNKGDYYRLTVVHQQTEETRVLCFRGIIPADNIVYIPTSILETR